MTIIDTAFIEREYDNRALVPEHPAFFERWTRDSEFVRRTLPARLDLAYGPDVRHRVDLFPARDARGTLVFVHGGYWRSLDKDMFSWLASPWVAAGLNVAMPRYRLVPAVRIDDVVDDVIAAVNWLFREAPAQGVAMERVVLAGHSAGGHLVAALFAAPRDKLAFPVDRILGGVAMSGVYEFEPLRHFRFNEDFRLGPGDPPRLDLAERSRSIPAPLVLAVGADESSEFRRQTQILARAWSPQVRAFLTLPGVNHFSIVDAFAERGNELHEAARALF